MRRRALSLVAGLALLAGAATARADRENAEFFAQRGEKAMREKAYDAAEGHYRRAVEEDAAFLPARAGLAEALAAQGRRGEAAAALRELLAAADAAPPLPAAWGEVVARARRRLKDLDVAGEGLSALLRTHADALAAFARGIRARNPALAERALRDALELVPDHTGARDGLVLLGKELPEGTVVIWDGQRFERWKPPPGDEAWGLKDGVLSLSLAKEARGLSTDAVYGGDFDLVMEARITKVHGEFPKVALVALSTGNNTGVVFGVNADQVNLDHETGPGESNRHRLWSALTRNVKPPFRASEWTSYEVRVRGEDLTVLVNGAPLRRLGRPGTATSGRVGFVVQDCRAEIRAFRLTPR